MSALLLMSACQQDFMDAKPDKALVVPTTIADYQAILDNFNTMNTPGLNLIAGDEFVTTDQMYQALEQVERQTYLWADDLYEGGSSTDWESCYKAVFTANIVLEGAAKLAGEGPSTERDNLLGYAYFYRANAFYGLAQQFAPAYEPQNAHAQMGIPLKLSAQVTTTEPRATLQQTYQQILSDLEQSQKLITSESVWRNRPSRAAALALKARVYLAMGAYDLAEQNASASLAINGQLVDFNELDAKASLTFPDSPRQANKEVIFYGRMNFYLFFFTPYYQVDPVLYASYDSTDLRKQCYYDTLADGAVWYKGSYAGSFGFFSGLANDELYLIRAECRARQGDTAPALADLNTLLEKRYKKGTFKPVQASEPSQALRVIIAERRKELVARGIRWTDLRRLNREKEFETLIRRRIDGKNYVLAPGSLKYTFPIPENEISASGIQQNPR